MSFRALRNGEPSTPRDTSIRTYAAKRDFGITAEPAPRQSPAGERPRMFVVQKHDAHRAGLHWDFRLEHGGVLWSWAVPQGPSLDSADRRVAVHVEDHPIDYADFQGNIPKGQYGAGTVETWDRGTWEPLGDPEQGMRKGELRFLLRGHRLQGRFILVRLGNRRGKQEGWFLIKGHDEHERPGIDALKLEAEGPAPEPPSVETADRAAPPAKGAVRGPLPETQEPQLSSVTEAPPEAPGWISEIKFDGYRLLAAVDHGKVRLLTRNGHDWANRLPAVVKAVGALRVRTAMLDGELVALRDNGTSSFPALQAALSEGRDRALYFYLFDLLHLNGWDLRDCKLLDRKRALFGLADWRGMLRYSDHVEDHAAEMRREACGKGLEGIICKRADAPYRPGRGRLWLKLKCQGREEMVVLGWTPPAGSRVGIGSLQVGYYDADGNLHYAGGVGTGFSDEELGVLRTRLDALEAAPPKRLLVAGEPLEPNIHWVRPELVVEIQFTSWSGAGRVRHSVYLGLREDKAARDVVLEVPDPDAERTAVTPRKPTRGASARHGPKVAVPPVQPARPINPSIRPRPRGSIVVAKAPKHGRERIGEVELTHADRQLWPGISKRDLAEYWLDVAEYALPWLSHRPLAIVRCPEGIQGEYFFQKRGGGLLPRQIREGAAAGSPYLVLDDVNGLVAMAQMSAIELHAWGASEADPLHPDWLVFDLDPGEGVAFDEVIRAAHDVRERLKRSGFESFPRTTGGKGLHLVVPIKPRADWDEAKAFARGFAEGMSLEEPSRFLSTIPKAERRGRILIDYLRNGLGNTAVASFCPRARPGAAVATPLSWDELKPGLDPARFTIRTVPDRLRKQKHDPWAGFGEAARPVPEAKPMPRRVESAAREQSKPATRQASPRIVYAQKPRRRS